jgi:hypothetical protein
MRHPPPMALGFAGRRQPHAGRYLKPAERRPSEGAIEWQRHARTALRLPALAIDLARRPVTVAAAGINAALGAKIATTTIPIVFVTGVDPVATGLVASLSRPGGNLTGVTDLAAELGQKHLELLRAVVTTARIVALLSQSGQSQCQNSAARTAGSGAQARTSAPCPPREQ